MAIRGREKVRDGYLNDLPENLRLKVMEIHKLIKKTVDDIIEQDAYEDLKESRWAMSCIDDFCVMPKDKAEVGSIRVYKKGKSYSCMIQATGHFRNHEYGWVEELLHDFIGNVYSTVRPIVRRKYDMTITNEGKGGEPFEGFDIYPNPKECKAIWDSLEDRKTRTITENGDEIDDIEEDYEDYYEDEEIMESVDLYYDIYEGPMTIEEYLIERSQGKLQVAHRLAKDCNTGHRLHIIYDLNGDWELTQNNVVDNKKGRNESERMRGYRDSGKGDISRAEIGRLRRWGNTDFESKGHKVLAIIDLDDNNKKLKSVTCQGPFGGENNYGRGGIDITVGEIDNNPTFKSTYWSKDPNMNDVYHISHREGHRVRGVRVARADDFKGAFTAEELADKYLSDPAFVTKMYNFAISVGDKEINKFKHYWRNYLNKKYESMLPIKHSNDLYDMDPKEKEEIDKLISRAKGSPIKAVMNSPNFKKINFKTPAGVQYADRERRNWIGYLDGNLYNLRRKAEDSEYGRLNRDEILKDFKDWKPEKYRRGFYAAKYAHMFDESVDANFEHYYDLYTESVMEEYFTEKSNGKLQVAHRLAVIASGPRKGHYVHIIYDLNGDWELIENHVIDDGTKFGHRSNEEDTNIDYSRRERGDTSDKEKGRIRKLGNTDFKSKGHKVLAIKDLEDNNKIIKEKIMVRGPYFNNTSDNEGRPIQMGTIDNYPSFKTTYWDPDDGKNTPTDIENREGKRLRGMAGRKYADFADITKAGVAKEGDDKSIKSEIDRMHGIYTKNLDENKSELQRVKDIRENLKSQTEKLEDIYDELLKKNNGDKNKKKDVSKSEKSKVDKYYQQLRDKIDVIKKPIKSVKSSFTVDDIPDFTKVKFTTPAGVKYAIDCIDDLRSIMKKEKKHGKNSVRFWQKELDKNSSQAKSIENWAPHNRTKVDKPDWNKYRTEDTETFFDPNDIYIESADDDNTLECGIKKLPKGLAHFVTTLNKDIHDNFAALTKYKDYHELFMPDKMKAALDFIDGKGYSGEVGKCTIKKSGDNYTGEIQVTPKPDRKIYDNEEEMKACSRLFRAIHKKLSPGVTESEPGKKLVLAGSRDEYYFILELESDYAEKLYKSIKNGTAIKESAENNEENKPIKVPSGEVSPAEAKKTMRAVSQQIINDKSNKSKKMTQYTANIYANIITKNLLPEWAPSFRKFAITLDDGQSFNTVEFKVPKMTLDFVDRFIHGRETLEGFIHRQTEIRMRMSPRTFQTMKSPDDAFNFFKEAIQYYDKKISKAGEKLMGEAMKLPNSMKHLVGTTKLSGIVTYPMTLLFVFDDVDMSNHNTFKLSQEDINTVSSFIRNISSHYAAPEKEKKKIVDDCREMVKTLRESCTPDDNIRDLFYLPESLSDFFDHKLDNCMKEYLDGWKNEQVDVEGMKEATTYTTRYMREAFGVKKLKKIPSDLVAYIQIETEAIKDANDKMMIASYCVSKIEIVEWYIELLEVGSKKYVVPHTKPWLENMRTQLLACYKKIMDTPIPKADRAIVSVQYPKGYEG